MGQEVQVVQYSGKGEAISVGGNLSGFNRSSPVLSKQSLYSDVGVLDPIELFLEPSTDKSHLNEIFIRALDITGSFLMLLLTAPILAVCAILIKLTSAGPVLYKQYRVGECGRIFTLYKLRTMVKDAEQIWGFTPATQDDERVTTIGKFLRRTRLDELPQLVNVLKGEMSLVGPRPENIYRVNMHASLRGTRLLVKPGITGLAQIRSFYDLKPEHKVKYDYLYIQKRSLFLNIYILLQTIPVIFLKKGW
jgi:lipopolysaccharide/colanic/teichoic acid biosynthesis glycosyltransferase